MPFIYAITIASFYLYNNNVLQWILIVLHQTLLLRPVGILGRYVVWVAICTFLLGTWTSGDVTLTNWSGEGALVKKGGIWAALPIWCAWMVVLCEMWDHPCLLEHTESGYLCINSIYKEPRDQVPTEYKTQQWARRWENENQVQIYILFTKTQCSFSTLIFWFSLCVCMLETWAQCARY